MYWCKIAHTEAEFEEIARLNYETLSKKFRSINQTPKEKK